MIMLAEPVARAFSCPLARLHHALGVQFGDGVGVVDELREHVVGMLRVVWRGRTSGRKPRLRGCPRAQACMLEQVGGLSIDLERILFVEQIQIEQFVRHTTPL